MMFGNLNRSRSKIDLRVVAGVLGAMTTFIGVALLLPLPMSLVDNEPIWWIYPASASLAFLIGGFLFWRFRPQSDLRSREAFMIVTLIWLIFSGFSALPFVFSGALSHFTDAFFEAMSGLTTTGVSAFGGVRPDGSENGLLVDQYRSILLWRSLTQWIGGMGFIVLGVAVLPFLNINGGSQLFHAESSTPTTDKLTPRVQETAALLWGTYLIITLAQFFLLWAHPKMDWFDALNHSMTTLATGGFSTQDASVAYYNSTYIDIVIIVFMYLSGLNFTMLFNVMRGNVSVLKVNREMHFFTFLSLAFILMVSGYLWYAETYATFGESLRYGAFQVMTILTTTGFATADYELWPSFAILSLYLLFFTSGCAGSTAGGVKSYRTYIMLKNLVREIRQTVHPKAVLPLRIGNRTLEPETARMVLSFGISYIGFFLIGALTLTFLGVDFQSAIWSSITCLGNVGTNIGMYGPTETYASMHGMGKWILSFLMMIGRLEVFTVLVLFSKAYWRE
jgi:trk system potassium uptake protein TrkH